MNVEVNVTISHSLAEIVSEDKQDKGNLKSHSFGSLTQIVSD